MVYEAVTDPEVPPLPPHITLAQAKAITNALRKGDPNARDIIKQSFKQKVEDLAGLRLLRDRAPAGMAIAAGAYGYDATYFARMAEAGAVDVLQADITRCGGITELLRIADYARGKGVETVPHAWKSGIIKAASLQCNAVMPDALFQEYCIADTPINQTLTQERLPIDADGMLTVPTAPGIGVTLDDEVVERYRVH